MELILSLMFQTISDYGLCVTLILFHTTYFRIRISHKGKGPGPGMIESFLFSTKQYRFFPTGKLIALQFLIAY